MVPIKYNVRNLVVRKRTTLAAAFVDVQTIPPCSPQNALMSADELM